MCPAARASFTWQYGWTFASYALIVRSTASDGASTEWLEGGATSAPFALSARCRAGAMDRHRRGATSSSASPTSCPNGLDHMLFVLGIFLLSGRARSVLWQVSAFTIAHSITLGLSMYGLISAAGRRLSSR